MWKVMDKLNKLAQTADKGWRPSLGVERGANIVHQYIYCGPASLESKSCRTVGCAEIASSTLKHLIFCQG
jgi:hypothetical protein